MGSMRKSKYDIEQERAQAEIDRIVESEGEPKTEEEAIEIFTRVWEKMGYKVKDARRGVRRG